MAGKTRTVSKPCRWCGETFAPVTARERRYLLPVRLACRMGGVEGRGDHAGDGSNPVIDAPGRDCRHPAGHPPRPTTILRQGPLPLSVFARKGGPVRT